jgi:hypothetical protein
MVDKGNVDKHRMTYSGGIKAVETEKWGTNKAAERYGTSKYLSGAPPPKDTHRPQAPEDKQGNNYENIHRKDWVRGFGKGGVESAEGMPNFRSGYKGKK